MIELLRERKSLVHLFIHDIVKSVCANSALVLGASPLCADNPEEIEELMSQVDVIYGNLGSNTKDRIQSMIIARDISIKRGIPFVLDCAGVAASSKRREIVYRLSKDFPISILKGNASEILALAKNENTARGVDTEIESTEIVKEARTLVSNLAEVICISGKTDLIIDRERMTKVDAGHPDMAKVTGTGCIGSLLVALFASIDLYKGAVNGMCVNAICGERAIEALKERGLGIGFYYCAFITELERIKDEDIRSLNLEETYV